MCKPQNLTIARNCNILDQKVKHSNKNSIVKPYYLWIPCNSESPFLILHSSEKREICAQLFDLGDRLQNLICLCKKKIQVVFFIFHVKQHTHGWTVSYNENFLFRTYINNQKIFKSWNFFYLISWTFRQK